MQLVPTLVLRMYDKQQTPVFKPQELRRLVEFFKGSTNASQIYETLKRGKAYRGYYATPFQEIVAIFNDLKAGKRPTATSK